MNETQKIIKYIAIAFAIFLAFTIITSIVGVISGIVNGVSGNRSDKTTDFSKVYENVDSITVDAYVYSLNVIQGDKYSVEFSNVSENYKSTLHNGNLELAYDGPGFGWFSWLTGETSISDSSVITVTIPADSKFDKFEIDAGTGL